MKITTLAIIASIGATATACGPSSDQPAQAQIDRNAAAAPVPAVDLVEANRPADEAQLLKAFSIATAEINAPNDIVRNQISDQRLAAWGTTVSALGELKSWTGKIEDIHETGWFSISLNDSLSVENSEAMATGGDDRPNPEYKSWLFDQVKQLSPGQPVRFTATIDPEFATVCFAIDHSDFSCTVKITSLTPLTGAPQQE